jgi:hypothetical protein
MMMQPKLQMIVITKVMRVMVVARERRIKRTTRSRREDRTPAEHSVALATNYLSVEPECCAMNFLRRNAASVTSAGSSTIFVSISRKAAERISLLLRANVRSIRSRDIAILAGNVVSLAAILKSVLLKMGDKSWF